ncbi:hypothetical protein [Halorarum salinum]|uniref:Uncharacterized protein n=1 Tax=Halorarum salinum TaxID=2743089 RepID=A0A7D5LC70_9EURY|nr:hypothetical protein [Halobaculum salinum]QLG63071.1 hypothetical protein HUG12_15555 [Halobaculum salinum]
MSRSPLTIAAIGSALVVGVAAAVTVVGPHVRDALGEFQSVLLVSAAIVGLIVVFAWADGASR